MAIDPAWEIIGEDNLPLSEDQYPVNRIAESKSHYKNKL
jgi:hypothetical protein